MFQVKEQVIVKQQTSVSGPVTKEIKVGTILAVGKDTVTVSFPKPGGHSVKREVLISDCAPVTEVFRRNSVQINPIHRQIYRGSV